LAFIGVTGGQNMLRCGYILGSRADWLWFLGFPYLAIAIALSCYHWLPAIAWASIALWITIPHHLATWLRTYGLSEDWQRWKGPLIVGPLVIAGMTLVGLRLAPTTVALVTMLWDHQHSLMQQHGLSRIYDFKARTGVPLTGRFDLLLHWFLYVNMLITAPLFVRLWAGEVYQWRLPVTPAALAWIQHVSWGGTAAYLLVYVGHALWCVGTGHAVNPVKYLFIGSSYMLWYFTSWHTDSFLVFGIAHRLMHGVQYIVIVNSYLGHKLEIFRRPSALKESEVNPVEEKPAPLGWLLRSYRLTHFIGIAAVYALLYQILILQPIDQFGFGVVTFMAVGDAPRLGITSFTHDMGYDLVAAALIQGLPITHYFFDSFVWKVSDAKVQQGL
jgi:hypothetical protein